MRRRRHMCASSHLVPHSRRLPGPSFANVSAKKAGSFGSNLVLPTCRGNSTWTPPDPLPSSVTGVIGRQLGGLVKAHLSVAGLAGHPAQDDEVVVRVDVQSATKFATATAGSPAPVAFWRESAALSPPSFRSACIRRPPQPPAHQPSRARVTHSFELCGPPLCSASLIWVPRRILTKWNRFIHRGGP
jgi:hypothetical protein